MIQSVSYRKILGKVTIKGIVECITGLHIGASKEGLEIGAIDGPVVRDPITKEPYIPGSSLKGKLRALLEKAHSNLYPNRDGGSGINRHECDKWEKGKEKNKNYDKEMEYPGALSCPVCRIFGSSGEKNFPSRLKVRDARLTEDSRELLENIDTGLLFTEWKVENSIDRITSAANPRNLERVPAGSKFEFEMIYDVEDTEQMREDLKNLQFAIRLLEDDTLGGHGSRGYGHVKFGIEKVEARRLEFYRPGEGAKNGVKVFNGLEEQDLKEMSRFFEE